MSKFTERRSDPMSFHFSTHVNGSTTVYLMTFSPFNPEDYYEKLTESELERLATFKAPVRKLEFVATRILRHELFGFQHIHYNAVGAPYLKDVGFISISHARNVVGIAVNAAYQVGLDLESFRPTINEVAHKFLSEREKSIFDCSDPRVLTSIWSAKEVLYKLAGRKQIHFKTELNLDRDTEGGWFGMIDNHDHYLKVNLAIFEIDTTIVTINTAAVEVITKN